MEKIKSSTHELDQLDSQLDHRFTSVEWVLLCTASLAFAAVVAMLAYSFLA